MAQGIERIVDRLDVDQTKGIFAVPEKFELKIESWLRRVRSVVTDLPLVVANEDTYTCSGIARKLKTTRASVMANVAHAGIVRPLVEEDFSYQLGVFEYVSPLSAAQLISWVFDAPIQNILVSGKKLITLTENKPVEERLDIMFNAYSGCYWFDSFVKKQKRIAENTGYLPKIKTHQRISREDLEDWFLCDNTKGSALRKLTETGILMPENKTYKKNTPHNLVDLENLAEFISRIYEIKKEKILVDDEAEMSELVNSFRRNRLCPYMDEKIILPETYYSLSESARRTGLNYHRIDQARRIGQIHPINVKRKELKIKGLNLALYALKRAERNSFTLDEVKDIFGIKDLNLIADKIKVSKHQTVSSRHYVFPLYDLVAERIKCNEENYPIKRPVFINVNGSARYTLSLKAQRDYCDEYGIKSFDNQCLRHLSYELNTSKQFHKITDFTKLRSTRPDRFFLETRDLIIEMEETTISGVKIRQDEYFNRL
ncbi:MAG: hypothetical protein Q8O89_08060 [Nanoarchaeota archaeon]|nr:hypothetical protein [Nanoarchaeota archaeon]